MSAEYNVAYAYSQAGREAEASALLDKLIAKATVPGKESWMIVARSFDLAAGMKEDKKDYAATLKLRQRAFDALSHGAPSAERALALTNLGMTHLKMNHFRDSLELLEQALALRQAEQEDPYELGRLHFAIAMSLEGLRRDHARALKLVKQAQDDFAKAQGGEGLKQYRETVARILRDAAKNP